MGDGERRPVGRQLVETALDQHLRLGVDIACRLVEDEDRGVFEDRPRDGDPLALAAGEFDAAFADHRLVAVGEVLDEIVGFGGLGGRTDVGVGRVEAPVGDVVPDGAVEEIGLLADVADGLSERAAIDGGDVLAVNPDRSRVGIVEPQQELENGRFPRPGRADECERIAALDGEIEIRQHRVLLVVAEAHVVVLDAPLAHDEVVGATVVFQRLGFVHQPEDPLGGGLRPLVHIDYLAELRHRPDKLLGEEDEDDELAGREGTGERAGARPRKDPQPADEEGEDEPRPGDELETGKEANADRDRTPVGLVVIAGHVVDTAGFEFFRIRGFDDLDAAEVVFEAGVHVADAGADGGVLRLDRLDEDVGEDRDQRDGRERDDRELRVEIDEIRGDGDDHDRQPEGGVQAVVEKPLQLVHVVREDRHQLAGLFVGEKAHVEPLHRVVGVGPHVVLDLLSEGVEPPVAQPVKARADDEGGRDEDDDKRELVDRLGRQPRLRHQREVEGFDALKQAVDGDAEQDHRQQIQQARGEAGEHAKGDRQPVGAAVLADQPSHRVVDSLALLFERVVFGRWFDATHCVR